MLAATEISVHTDTQLVRVSLERRVPDKPRHTRQEAHSALECLNTNLVGMREVPAEFLSTEDDLWPVHAEIQHSCRQGPVHGRTVIVEVVTTDIHALCMLCGLAAESRLNGLFLGPLEVRLMYSVVGVSHAAPLRNMRSNIPLLMFGLID